mgnify:CR=1 FL=1
MTPRCAYNRHCNEETIGDGPDRQPYRFDHLGEVLSEAERESDEHGRNPKVMKNARAMRCGLW